MTWHVRIKLPECIRVCLRWRTFLVPFDIEVGLRHHVLPVMVYCLAHSLLGVGRKMIAVLFCRDDVVINRLGKNDNAACSEVP